jgi:hypothetical protein
VRTLRQSSSSLPRKQHSLCWPLSHLWRELVDQKLYIVFVVTIWRAVVGLLNVMLKESHAIDLKTDGDNFSVSERYLVTLSPWMALAMRYGRREVTLLCCITIEICCSGK